MPLEILEATISDLDQINAVYREIEFEPSAIEKDRTFFVRTDAEIVATTRINVHASDYVELGGVWVAKSWRGRSLARELVEHALTNVPPGATCYCIPYTHLVPFYESFGFTMIGVDAAPTKVAEKFNRCKIGAHPNTAILCLRHATGI